MTLKQTKPAKLTLIFGLAAGCSFAASLVAFARQQQVWPHCSRVSQSPNCRHFQEVCEDTGPSGASCWYCDPFVWELACKNVNSVSTCTPLALPSNCGAKFDGTCVQGLGGFKWDCGGAPVSTGTFCMPASNCV